MHVPKKWWWVVAVVVPLAAASIKIIPLIWDRAHGGDTIYVDVVGNQFNGQVAFNSVTVVAEQAQQKSGEELPESVLELLRQATDFIQSREFERAIPLLQSAEEAAPVPAVYNNLGAAYLASGYRETARRYFEKALTGSPEEKTTAHFNFNQFRRARPPSGSIGPREPSDVPGLEAEVTRFEDTGGMITLEVIFRNIGPDAVAFCTHPAIYEKYYLLDERTGKRWDPADGGGGIPCYGAKQLNPGNTHLIWLKYQVGDEVPAQFTAVIARVPRPFEGLVLR